MSNRLLKITRGRGFVILSGAKNLTRSVILNEVKDLGVPSPCSGQASVAMLLQNDNKRRVQGDKKYFFSALIVTYLSANHAPMSTLD
jgi:hypothetical protein